ncbi:MAG: hypothetical protein V1820_03375 [archaeon]
MRTKELLDFYSREDVQDAILSFGKNREVVGRRLRGEYNKRPDNLVYPADVLSHARDGVTSFHASVELWKNPLALATGMGRNEISENRLGWDFLIDLDGKVLEHSKIAADLILKAFEAHGLSEIPVKFSGRAGFHIMVPFRLFPKEIGGKQTESLFPELPRALAEYLGEFIRESFRDRLVEHEGGAHKLAEALGTPVLEILDQKKKVDPFKAVKIDSILISSRHLVRAPYSFNEKSWLVSIPVKQKEILEFDTETAKPANVGQAVKFEGGRGRATDLVESALLYSKKRFSPAAGPARNFGAAFSASSDANKPKLSGDFFPPCIAKLLSEKKVEDGRKRRLFILQSFLQSAGWSVEELSSAAREWNAGISNPLPSTYLEGQLSYLSRQKKRLVAPNCASDGFYKELGLCVPDRFCEGVKNPITSALRRLPRRAAAAPSIPAKPRTGRKPPK